MNKYSVTALSMEFSEIHFIVLFSYCTRSIVTRHNLHVTVRPPAHISLLIFIAGPEAFYTVPVDKASWKAGLTLRMNFKQNTMCHKISEYILLPCAVLYAVLTVAIFQVASCSVRIQNT